MHFYISISLKKFRKVFLLFVFLYASPALFAQPGFDTDSAYQMARTFAFSGKRQEARILLRKILEAKPEYAEIQTLLARTYAWDGKYDSARTELLQVLSYSPKNEDATNALLDTELWSDNYSGALLLADKALKEINLQSEEFFIKKARAQYNLEKYKEAYLTIGGLLYINPKNEKALSLAESIKKELRINKLGVSYDYDKFSSSFTPWTGISAFYSRKTKYLGSVIGRINYANRFNERGVQYEADMYPKITKKIYSYFNVGISEDDIFPDFRFGFSLYSSFPKSFEGEIGFRYLKFNSSTLIYTGSVSKYISNFWFSLRPTLIPDRLGYSKSLSIISRYYLQGSSDNYLNLTLSTGLSPDQYNKDLNLAKAPNVSSKAIKLGFQHLFDKQFIFSTGFIFRKDEYRKDSFRNNFNFSTGLEVFFE